MTHLHEVRLYLVDLAPLDASGSSCQATAPSILFDMP